MSLTPEDGTGKSDADSFVSVADADVYHDGRLHNTDWTDAPTETKEAALKWATRVLERLSWKGLRGSTTQALAWPRNYVLKRDPIDTDDYYVNNIVPVPVKNATAELAFRLIQLDRGADPETMGIRSMKAGSLEMTFDINDRNLRRLITPEAMDAIAHMLEMSSFGFGRVVRV